MFFISTIIFITLIATIATDIFLLIKLLEFIYCANIRHQPPFVASGKLSRKSVIQQITTKYPNAKNICEIGSGFGGLARTIARGTNANVYALENMPFTAFVSKTLDKLTHCKNNTTVWCDAFKFLAETDKKFDIAIAYMGPTATPMLTKYKTKIKVLISLDFEIPNLPPVFVLNTEPGYTIYNKRKYPHRLFIYDFAQNK